MSPSRASQRHRERAAGAATTGEGAQGGGAAAAAGGAGDRGGAKGRSRSSKGFPMRGSSGYPRLPSYHQLPGGAVPPQAPPGCRGRAAGLARSSAPLLVACLLSSLVTYGVIHGMQSRAANVGGGLGGPGGGGLGGGGPFGSGGGGAGGGASLDDLAWRQLPGANPGVFGAAGTARADGDESLRLSAAAHLLQQEDAAAAAAGGRQPAPRPAAAAKQPTARAVAAAAAEAARAHEAAIAARDKAAAAAAAAAAAKQQHPHPAAAAAKQAHAQQAAKPAAGAAAPATPAAAAPKKPAGAAAAAAAGPAAKAAAGAAAAGAAAAAPLPYGHTGKLRAAVVNHAPYHLEVVAGWLHVLAALDAEVIWYQAGQVTPDGNFTAEGLLEAQGFRELTARVPYTMVPLEAGTKPVRVDFAVFTSPEYYEAETKAFLAAALPISSVMLVHNGANHALQRLKALAPRTHVVTLAPHVAAAARLKLGMPDVDWAMATLPFAPKVRRGGTGGLENLASRSLPPENDTHHRRRQQQHTPTQSHNKIHNPHT